MCISEALLRIPDDDTAEALIAEKIATANWAEHVGQSDSVFLNASTWALMLTGSVIGLGESITADVRGWINRLAGRMGESVARAAMSKAVRILGAEFVQGRTHRGGVGAGRWPSRLLRHARRGRTHLCRRRPPPGGLPARNPGHWRCVSRRHANRRFRDLDQVVRAAPALRAVAGEARIGRTPRHRQEPCHRGRVAQPAPHHRRRGGGAAGVVARALRDARTRARIEGLARSRAGRAGLLEARRRRDRLARRSRAPSHGPPREGRILGPRDQARPGRRTRRLPGVHAQAVHGLGLHRLRRTALREPSAVPTVRHAQRLHRQRGSPSRVRHGPRVRVPTSARHGRTALRRSAPTVRGLPTGAGLRARWTAQGPLGIPRTTAARERCQLILRQPLPGRRDPRGRTGARPHDGRHGLRHGAASEDLAATRPFRRGA